MEGNEGTQRHERGRGPFHVAISIPLFARPPRRRANPRFRRERTWPGKGRPRHWPNKEARPRVCSAPRPRPVATSGPSSCPGSSPTKPKKSTRWRRTRPRPRRRQELGRSRKEGKNFDIPSFPNGELVKKLTSQGNHSQGSIIVRQGSRRIDDLDNKHGKPVSHFRPDRLFHKLGAWERGCRGTGGEVLPRPRNVEDMRSSESRRTI